jgi:hypothetical protein
MKMPGGKGSPVVDILAESEINACTASRNHLVAFNNQYLHGNVQMHA